MHDVLLPCLHRLTAGLPDAGVESGKAGLMLVQRAGS